MTELQVTACVFGSNYAFHLTAEGLAASGAFFLCRFFVRFAVLPFPLQGFEVTHSIFDKFRTRLPDTFHHLVPSDNFHCQTPLKNAKFDLFGSEKRVGKKKPVGKSGCQ